MRERENILAVDLGGTKTALAVFDVATKSMIAKHSIDSNRKQSPEDFIIAIKALFANMLHEHGRSLVDTGGIGMAVCGPVDANGVLLDAGKFEHWKNVRLQTDLAETFGAPSFVEQDANAGALGEAWLGCAQGVSDFVFLSLGTGIGAGIMAGGRLLRGAHSAAGELGDLIVDRTRLGKGRREEHDVDGAIGSAHLHAFVSSVLGEDISPAKALTRASEDPRLASFHEYVVDHIALVVIALVAVLDPSKIVLGGGLARAGDSLLVPLRERLSKELLHEVPIERSHLGVDTQLFGVAKGVLDRERTPI